MARKRTIATGIGTGISIVALMFFVVVPARAGIFDSFINAYNAAVQAVVPGAGQSQPQSPPSPPSKSVQTVGDTAQGDAQTTYEYAETVDMTADPRCSCDTSYETEDCDPDGDKKFTAAAQSGASCVDAYSVATESANVKRLLYKKYDKKAVSSQGSQVQSIPFIKQSLNPNIVSSGHFCIKDQCTSFDTNDKSYINLGCYTKNALPGSQRQELRETPESCIAKARKQGLKYAGLSNGGHCFIGNNFVQSTLAGLSCPEPCDADPSKECGGLSTFVIYTATLPPQPRQRILADRGGWLCVGGDAKCLKRTDFIGDRDGDGAQDIIDDCPDTPGLIYGTYYGCPIERAQLVNITYGENDLSVTFHVKGDIASIGIYGTTDGEIKIGDRINCPLTSGRCGVGTGNRKITVSGWSCYKVQKKKFLIDLYSGRPIYGQKQTWTKELPCNIEPKDAKIVGWSGGCSGCGPKNESAYCEEGDPGGKTCAQFERSRSCNLPACESTIAQDERNKCLTTDETDDTPDCAEDATKIDCNGRNEGYSCHKVHAGGCGVWGKNTVDVVRCKVPDNSPLPSRPYDYNVSSPLSNTNIGSPSGTGCVGLTTCGNR